MDYEFDYDPRRDVLAVVVPRPAPKRHDGYGKPVYCPTCWDSGRDGICIDCPVCAGCLYPLSSHPLEDPWVILRQGSSQDSQVIYGFQCWVNGETPLPIPTPAVRTIPSNRVLAEAVMTDLEFGLEIGGFWIAGFSRTFLEQKGVKPKCHGVIRFKIPGTGVQFVMFCSHEAEHRADCSWYPGAWTAEEAGVISILTVSFFRDGKLHIGG